MNLEVDTGTPVLLLGGKENSLSIARSLGKLGVTVRASGPSDCWALHSKFCSDTYPVPPDDNPADYWHQLLVESPDRALLGSVLIYLSDAAIQFVASHRAELEDRYCLDHSQPAMQLAMLDKAETLRLADKAGVGIPGYRLPQRNEDLSNLLDGLQLPVIVKPLISHEFYAVFGTKYFRIDDPQELEQRIRDAWSNDLEVMVVELIEGPDSTASSFYAYVDTPGAIRGGYTKRIIRRYPKNNGPACFHESFWDAETAKAGQTFLAGIGFTGIACIEFKRDPRDGQLKIIECNARFTAAQELLKQAGVDLDVTLYCQATHQPAPEIPRGADGLRFWYPIRDLLALRELRRLGELSISGWLRSIWPMRHVSPLFDTSDLRPVFAVARGRARQFPALLRKVGRD